MAFDIPLHAMPPSETAYYCVGTSRATSHPPPVHRWIFLVAVTITIAVGSSIVFSIVGFRERAGSRLFILAGNIAPMHTTTAIAAGAAGSTASETSSMGSPHAMLRHTARAPYGIHLHGESHGVLPRLRSPKTLALIPLRPSAHVDGDIDGGSSARGMDAPVAKVTWAAFVLAIIATVMMQTSNFFRGICGLRSSMFGASTLLVGKMFAVTSSARSSVAVPIGALVSGLCDEKVPAVAYIVAQATAMPTWFNCCAIS